MSFETRARREAQEALDSIRGVSVMEQLVELKQRDRSRRRTNVILGASAVAAVIVAGGWFVNAQTGASDSVPASDQPSETIAQAPCGSSVTCLGNDRYTVALARPVTLTLTPDFDEGLDFSPGSTVLDTYRNDAGAGVAVLEKAVPAKYDESWSRDPEAGRTAESVARWLSRRPFLEDTTLTQTTLGGLPAWRVTGKLKPDAALPADKKSIQEVAPTFFNESGQAAYGRDLTGEYTLADVPGAGLTVVWSWTREGADLTPNQAVIDSISFD